MSEDKEKILPINKYSIYELKSGIDSQITKHLDKIGFKENQKLSNLKIIVGILTLSCTSLAYFYPKPFPQNYWAIFIAVIGYLIFSTLYWYVDKYIISNVFYIGNNDTYFKGIQTNKEKNISMVTICSEVQEYSFNYKILFRFEIAGRQEPIESKENIIDCTTVYDERGYIQKDIVIKKFSDIFNEEIRKI